MNLLLFFSLFILFRTTYLDLKLELFLNTVFQIDGNCWPLSLAFKVWSPFNSDTFFYSPFMYASHTCSHFDVIKIWPVLRRCCMLCQWWISIMFFYIIRWFVSTDTDSSICHRYNLLQLQYWILQTPWILNLFFHLRLVNFSNVVGNVSCYWDGAALFLFCLYKKVCKKTLLSKFIFQIFF